MTPTPVNSPSASDPSIERYAERELRSRFPLERTGSAGVAVSVAASVTSSALASATSGFSSAATAVDFSSLVAN